MLQFAALSPAHNFSSLAPKFTLPFSSFAPITARMCTQKGSDQHHETSACGRITRYVWDRRPPPIPSRVHRRRKPAFLNCSTAGVHSRGRVKPDSPPPLLPKTGPRSTPPPPPPRLHPLLLLSCHTSTTRTQAHPSNPSCFFCLTFPLLAFAFAAQRGRYVSRQARSGRLP